MRVWGVTASVLLGVAVTTSPTLARPAPAAPPSIAQLDPTLATTLVDIATDHGGPGFGAAAAQATGLTDPLANTDPWFALLVPDLDGDGAEDLLDLRYTRDHAPEFTLQVRRGSDGGRLWRFETERKVSIPFLTTLADGAPGIGLFQIDYTVSLTDWEFYVISFDAQGRKLFERQLTEQTYGPAGLLSAEPLLQSVLPGGSGSVTEVLLGLDTQTFGLGVGGLTTSTHLFQVQGMSMLDGSISDRGELLNVIGFSPTVQAVGDLTGDGPADFVVLHGTHQMAETNGVAVARARDGETLWTRPGLRVGSLGRAESARDVTGDELDDVIISAFGGVGGPGLYLSPGGGNLPDPLGLFGIPGDVPQTVTLIEAAEGEVRWERAGLFGQLQNDISGDDIDDTMVWDVQTVEDAHEVRVTALTGVGAIVYDSVLGRLPTTDGEQAGRGVGVYAIGDVDDDGAEDLHFILNVWRDQDTVDTIDGLGDGRTGRIIRRDIGIPLWGSLDGNGADVQRYEFNSDAQSGHLEVFDGLTGRRLARLDLRARTTGFSLLATSDLDHDDCPDLVLGTRLGPDVSDVYALSTVSDEPLWALRRADRADLAAVGDVSLTSAPGLCTRGLDRAPPVRAPRPASGGTREPLPATGAGALGGVLAALAVAAAVTLRPAVRRRRPA